MLTDHSRTVNREAQEAKRHHQAQQDLGNFIDDLDYWDWIGTITFRRAVASERAFRLVKDWSSRVEKAAGGRITSAMAVSRGEFGGRVHIHFLLAGVDNLDMKEWETNAIRLFGDCKIEDYDPEKGGCHYFAKNALAEHGDYRLGGKAIEERIAAEEEETKTEIVAPHPQSKPSLGDPKRQAPSNQSIRPATVKRVVAYVRIGAETKADDVILRERIQARPIEQFIRKRGWRLHRVYRDVAGAKAGKRWPQFSALIAAARRGEVDVVIVSRLDRIARNTREVLTVLVELQTLGVDFVSLENGFDTTHRRGRALFAVVTSLIEMEGNLRSELAEAGLENAKRQGTKIGRPRAVVDIVEILKLKHKGLGVRRIGRKVGVSPTTVQRALRAHQQVSKSLKTRFETDRGTDQQ